MFRKFDALMSMMVQICLLGKKIENCEISRTFHRSSHNFDCTDFDELSPDIIHVFIVLNLVEDPMSRQFFRTGSLE